MVALFNCTAILGLGFISFCFVVEAIAFWNRCGDRVQSKTEQDLDNYIEQREPELEEIQEAIASLDSKPLATVPSLEHKRVKAAAKAMAPEAIAYEIEPQAMDYASMKVTELRAIAKERKLKRYSRMTKAQLASELA